MSELRKHRQSPRIIGYWMSEKKSQKLNWCEFSAVCRKHGFDLVKLDLNVSLEDQGPFTVILHKLTDIIALAGKGNTEAQTMLRHVVVYLENHPEVAVIDPLENVRKVLNRYHSYSIIHNAYLEGVHVFIPTFVELTSTDHFSNVEKLKSAGIKFPFVCKPSVAHGSSDAHKMALIFNEDGVKDCRPPCVAQTFINHNAVLYKIYFVGDKYSLVERPSLKNFYPCDRETIFFDSHAVSKADSTSSLSVLDPEDVAEPVASPLLGDQSRFQSIVDSLRREFGMALLGVDVVVENGTGRYAIIDVNAYPSYDGFPNYFENLMNCILETVDSHSSNMKPLSLGELYDPFIKPSLGSRSSHTSPGSLDQDDSGFDTSDSSDEKKKHDMSLSGKTDSFAIGSCVVRFRLLPDEFR